MNELVPQIDEEVNLASVEKSPRVRLSVSPNFAHLSQARVALFGYFFVLQRKGELILRVDDLKENEKSTSLLESVIDYFKWMKIHSSEGGGNQISSFYSQSERKLIYQNYLQKLIDQKKAYFCFCPLEKLEEDRRRFLAQGRPPRYTGTCRSLSEGEVASLRDSGKHPIVRLRVERQIVKFNDLIHGPQSIDSEEIGDLILQSATGQFTYDFASAVDDLEMQITHIFRTDNELLQTPNQILIYNSFGASFPEVAHIPLILGPDRLLISEKHGSVTLIDLRKEGYLPAALVNYIGLLGWIHAPRLQILSSDELIKKFEIKNIARLSPLLDWDKLKKTNAHYLKELPFSDFLDLCRTLIPNYKDLLNKKGEEWVESTLKLLQPQSKTIGEVGEVLQVLVYPIRSFSDEAKRFFFKDSAKILKLAKLELSSLNELDLDHINIFLKTLKEKAKSKAINFYIPLRVSLTGRSQGADLSLIISLLGKGESLDRIDYAIKNLQHIASA